ncbi:MAG: TIR domain-containing protein [Anaerolineae bacterium]|nr:TIR domain-containing protein [Anaerolineae bacterium]
MPLVFISYSRDDSDFVLRLAKDLRDKEIPIWLDQFDIPPGAPWDVTVEQALDDATHFLFVMTESAIESRNVRDELGFALDEQKTIVPVMFKDCRPPLRVRRMQYTDFRGDYASALVQLIGALPDPPAPTPSEDELIASQPVELKPEAITAWIQALVANPQKVHPVDPDDEFNAWLKKLTAAEAEGSRKRPSQASVLSLKSLSDIKTVKIVITGPFGSGKTEFIRSISEIEVVSTESEIPKESKTGPTVSMDFGRITVDDNFVLYLFSTPGDPRFDFMWEILSEGMVGFVVIVDSTRPETFRQAKSILNTFRSYDNVPYVIAANKQDKPEAWTPDDLRLALWPEDDIKIIPCIATETESVKNVLLELIYSILEERESGSKLTGPGK